MHKTLSKLALLAVPFFILSCGTNKAKDTDNYRVVVTNETTIAETIYGKVQGYLDGDVFTFKGIPYA